MCGEGGCDSDRPASPGCGGATSAPASASSHGEIVGGARAALVGVSVGETGNSESVVVALRGWFCRVLLYILVYRSEFGTRTYV
jgi:hypothetical protein